MKLSALSAVCCSSMCSSCTSSHDSIWLNCCGKSLRLFHAYANTHSGSSSPTGSYSQEMPPRCVTCGLPPHLPPLLQLTVLNQEPPSSVRTIMHEVWFYSWKNEQYLFSYLPCHLLSDIVDTEISRCLCECCIITSNTWRTVIRVVAWMNTHPYMNLI